MNTLSIDDLVFIGLRGYAIALHRETGDVVWQNAQMKSGHATLLLDGDRLIVSTNGYIYCLDPLTGQVLWENPLRGYGIGIASLASVRGTANPIDAMAAAEQAAASHSHSAG